MNTDIDNNDLNYLDESNWSDKYKELTHDRVRDLFDYNPEQGLLIWKERPLEDFKTEGAWKIWNTRYSGEVFGYTYNTNKIGKTPDIRRKGTINTVKDYLHYRLVWIYHNKKIPKMLDHIDRNSLNDSIENLRPTNYMYNNRNISIPSNNTSGVIGIGFCKKNNKWKARLTIKGREIHLGLFTNIESAIKARKEAEIKYGFFPNHGKEKPLS